MVVGTWRMADGRWRMAGATNKIRFFNPKHTTMSQYQQLEVWRTAILLAKDVYATSAGFPKEELFGLTAQMKRAAVSIPANIAEGSGRQYKKDALQFLFVSRGSAYELETLFVLALETSLISEERILHIKSGLEKTLKLLNGYINYVKNSQLK